MPETPTATSGRLFSLLSLLQTPREWPGPELADRLHVTTRTVRNDVERLRTLGYPVEATRGPIGGYRLVAGTAMPPLLLEDEEAVAVAVSLRTASGGAVSGMEESALRALTKLQQVLPKRLGHRVDALQSHTARVAPYSRGPGVDGALLTLIANAARDRELVRFDYSDRSGQGSERKVEPYRLVNWGRRWYLVAFDPQRDDWRTFRVDRLKETRLHRTPLPAARPARRGRRSVGRLEDPGGPAAGLRQGARAAAGVGRGRAHGSVARRRRRRAARRRRLPADHGRAHARRPGVLDRRARRRLRGGRLPGAGRGRRAAGVALHQGRRDEDGTRGSRPTRDGWPTTACPTPFAAGTPIADVAAATGGVHAQILSAAEVSAALRVEGATRADVRRALWEDQSVVKTFGPRGTVHLLPTVDLGRWMAALGAVEHTSPFPDGIRMSPEETATVVEAIRTALARRAR